MKRFITWLFALPIGIVAVALAVANRKPVLLALDPFRPENPAYAVSVPLFALVFAALILGVLLGGFTVWWRQGIHRRAARFGRREAERLEAEKTRLAAQVPTEAAVAAGLALPAPDRRAA